MIDCACADIVNPVKRAVLSTFYRACPCAGFGYGQGVLIERKCRLYSAVGDYCISCISIVYKCPATGASYILQGVSGVGRDRTG